MLLLVPAWARTDPKRLLDEILETVEQHFYDPSLHGVDLRARRPRLSSGGNELSQQLNGWLGLLRASHTVYYPPDSKGYHELLGVFSSFGRKDFEEMSRYDGVGLETLDTPQGTFIKGLWDGFPAQKAGLLVGERIVAVNGAPYDEIASFQGKKSVEIVVQRTPETASQRTVTVAVESILPAAAFETALQNSVEIRHTQGCQLGYLHVWSYAGERYHHLVQQELCRGRLKECHGVVIDLRDGWGGATPDYLNLFNSNLPRLAMKQRGRPWSDGDNQWRKPVVLLVNGNSRSGKEILAYGFRKYKLGLVVGDKTPGAVLGGRPYLLKAGGVLYLAVADVTVDGERLEGIGVEPDIPVARPIPYCQGADPQKARAFEVLLQTVLQK